MEDVKYIIKTALTMRTASKKPQDNWIKPEGDRYGSEMKSSESQHLVITHTNVPPINPLTGTALSLLGFEVFQYFMFVKLHISNYCHCQCGGDSSSYLRADWLGVHWCE